MPTRSRRPSELAIAKQLVESLAGEFEPDKYSDTYREEVLALVERKAPGEEIAVQPAAGGGSPGPDLMAALKASLDEVRARESDGEATPEKAAQRSRRRSPRRARRPRPRSRPPRRPRPERRPRPPSRSPEHARLRRADCSGPGLPGAGTAAASATSTRTARGSRTPRSSRGSPSSSSRRPGRTSGSALPGGHIQATGIDDRGRKQYLYHPRWRERRDQEKFERMVVFARALPACAARRADSRATTCAASTFSPAPCACSTAASSASAARTTRCRTRATASRRCARSTCAWRRHVVFDYPAKSGKRRVQAVVDPRSPTSSRALKRRRGGRRELLAYKRGAPLGDVRSDDINAYLKDTTGQTSRPRTSARGARPCSRRCARGQRRGRRDARPGASARSRARSRRSPTTSATRRRWRGRPTSTRACSTATATARRSARRCRRSPMTTATHRDPGPGEEAVLELID